MESAARVSREAYLAAEPARDVRVEYYGGATVAMAGASPRHNLVVGNVHEALRRALRPRGCFVAQSDQRVRLAGTDAWLYPDIGVACSPRFEEPRPQSLVNPELVVEVLSGSTEAHDLSAKLAHYRAAPSIAEIVFVHLSERLVEHHRRVEPAQWLVTLVRDGAVELTGVDVSVALADVYAGIDALPD